MRPQRPRWRRRPRAPGTALSHIDLPNGFLPEGIATGSGHTAYLGSRADGDIYRLDLRTGRARSSAKAPGRRRWGSSSPTTGSSSPVAPPATPGSSTPARAAAADVHLALTGTPAFINDVIVTDKAAWFTDSLRQRGLPDLPLDDHGSPRSRPPLAAQPGRRDEGRSDRRLGPGPRQQRQRHHHHARRRALLVINSSNGAPLPRRPTTARRRRSTSEGTR